MFLPGNAHRLRLLVVWCAPFLCAGAAGPPPLTVEQQARLTERDQFSARAKKLKASGKLVEALAAAEKMLAIERTLPGGGRKDVAGSLRLLGEIQEERQDFAAARRAWQETLVIETRLHGDKHWRVANARWALNADFRGSSNLPI